MTPLHEPREGDYTGIVLTNTNVSYGMVDKEMERENGGAEYEYDVVRAPQPHLPSHPKLESALAEGYEESYDALEHHQRAPVEKVPLTQNGGETGTSEAFYEPIP